MLLFFIFNFSEQLNAKSKKPMKRKNILFEEGWVEFVDKRIAKRVAKFLNNQRIGGKRRCPWYEELWNMKYLPKFKWTHLNERLAYEREVHKQRLRTEITQAKKKTNHYIQNVEKRQIQKKLEKQGKELRGSNREWSFRQRDTEEEILAKKRKQIDSVETEDIQSKKRKQHPKDQPNKTMESDKKMSKNKSFLKSIFSGGLNASSDEDS